MNIRSLDFDFAPDGQRTRQLDASAHALLADSLQHIQERAAEVLGPNVLDQLITRLRQNERFGPACFGYYYELALALMDGRYEEARQTTTLLLQQAPAKPGIQLIALDELGDEQRGLYLRLMDTDPHTSFTMLAPPPDLAESFRQRFEHAFQLMKTHLPDLAAEITGLIREICMVTGDTSSAYQFDGGSSYMLWGGLFLNIESHTSDVALIEVLAHESAHSLLFGLTQNESLVTNTDSELYQSPLRIDPRPMDGIYHATYVSARMHQAMSGLLESGWPNPEQAIHIIHARDQDAENFWGGYEVIKAHGQLTATGQAILNTALAYMQTYAPIA